jgi:hypothetical protein
VLSFALSRSFLYRVSLRNGSGGKCREWQHRPRLTKPEHGPQLVESMPSPRW